MTLQFTWQGCDSLLAAPLVLDLVRFVELSQRRGEIGLLSHLGSFFKRPLGLKQHAFTDQFALLADWAAGLRLVHARQASRMPFVRCSHGRDDHRAESVIDRSRIALHFSAIRLDAVTKMLEQCPEVLSLPG